MTFNKKLISSLLLFAALALYIFVSVPFEIYCNNLAEFSFVLEDFFYLSLGFSLAAILLLTAATSFLPDNVFRIVYGILSGITLMFYIQGTYLSTSLSSLAGDDMAIGGFSPTEIIINTAIWCAVIAATTILYIKLSKKEYTDVIYRAVSVIIFGIQVINFSVYAIWTDDVFITRVEKAEMSSDDYCSCVLTTKNLTELSENDNILYFCIDRLDTEYIAQALDDYPDLFEELDGFTYYDDYITIYGHTFPSVACMLTNKRYTDYGHREEFLNSAYSDAATFSALTNNGYRLQLYMPAYYSYSDAYYLYGLCDNAELTKGFDTGFVTKCKLSFIMTQIGLFRSLPGIAKPLLSQISSDAANNCVDSTSQSEDKVYFTDTKAVYENISDTAFSTTSDKIFKYIHVDGCHNTNYDADWNTPGTRSDSVYNSLKIVKRYIEQLKATGAYDSATIIITGDHSAPHNDLGPINEERLTGLFVKMSGATDGFSVSDTPVSQDNIWATISESAGLGAEFGKSISDIKDAECVVRTFIWQTWASNACTEYTYEIYGAGSNFDNWKKINQVRYECALSD